MNRAIPNDFFVNDAPRQPEVGIDEVDFVALARGSGEIQRGAEIGN